MAENDKIKEIIEKFTSDDYNPELLDVFQDWISAEDNEEAVNEALFDLWNRSSAKGSKTHAEEIFQQVYKQTQKVPEEKKYRFSGRYMQVAAVVALFFASALWMYMTKKGTGKAVQEVLIVQAEEQPIPAETYLMLADGSEVWVQPESNIEIAGERENKLYGDAIYKVKREYLKGRQFTVETEHLSVTVLGTIFRVTSLPGSDETLVSLYEGALKVTMPGGDYELKSGEKFIYNNHTGSYHVETIPGAWPEQAGERLISYQMKDIASVFREMESIYNVSVDYSNYSWAMETVTMKFSSATNLESLLYMLAGISGNLEYRITDNNIYVFDKQD